MIRLLAATIALVLTSAAALGAGDGPLNKKLVPADATWVFHLDMESLRASTLGEFLEDPDLEKDLGAREREQLSRIRPVLRKLVTVTLYGKDDPQEAVVLLRTTATAEEFFAAMTCDDSLPEIVERTVEVGGHTLRSWSVEGETVYGFADAGASGPSLVFLSSDQDNIVGAIETARGRLPSLAGSGGELDAAATPRPGSMLVVAASNLDRVKRDGPASFLLENTKAIRVELGEHEGQVFASAALTTSSEASARQLAEMARGLLAMGQLSIARDERNAPLCGMLEALSVTADGSTATLSIAYPSEKLVGAYEAAKHAARSSKRASKPAPDAKDVPAAGTKKPGSGSEPTGR